MFHPMLSVARKQQALLQMDHEDLDQDGEESSSVVEISTGRNVMTKGEI